MAITVRRFPLHWLGPLAVALTLCSCGAADNSGDGLSTDGDESATISAGVRSSVAGSAADPPDQGGARSTTSALSVRVGSDPSSVDPGSTSGPSATTGVGDPSGGTVASTVGSTAAPTTDPATTTTAEPEPGGGHGSPQEVRLRFESMVADVPVADLRAQALAILNDPRGWGQAGFTFVSDPDGPYRVVLAEGAVVDQLCLPLKTYGTVSCQNGPVVALNADRWRSAVDHWVLGVEVYRGYLVNHEVGHLIGQRHPKPRCPVVGRPAGVMEQQTAGLKGCVGNPWPRGWELEYAGRRPVVYAPLPDWGPDPVPANRES